jgi:serine/threonine protein kinase/Tol biopolymer transport system component
VTNERWTDIDRLLGEALEREPHERAAFLQRACADNEELRREVESLMAHAGGAGDFLEHPALELVGTVPTLARQPLSVDSQLGPYRILGLVGSGGMGDVYRARDTRLERDVALKVLPALFAADSDRLARFKREAQVLASLNHPHIAAIYGFEDFGTLHAIVLELVEGGTLAERITRGSSSPSHPELPLAGRAATGSGRGLPLSEALDIARQIAGALEAAHERGIVHRDLKPANVKITPAGVVKVLDFGLAKAVAGDGSGPDLTQVSILTMDGTSVGPMLGTPAYMSPEQARGQPVDKRTDIWSFGCVLYEMLAGRTAFGRSTVTDTLAAILHDDPDWNALPRTTSPSLQRLLQRSLAKDRNDRLRDIRDIRFAIEDSTPGKRIAELPIVALRSRRLRLSIGISLLLAAALGIGWWAGRRSAPAGNLADPLAEARVARLTDFPGSESDAAISSDGKFVVFVSDRAGTPDVWLNQLGTGHFTNLTQGRESPSEFISLVRNVGISHDGSDIWLAGRFPDRRLRLMPLLGGPSRIFLSGNVVNVAWSSDGALLAYHTGAPGDPMFVADRTGGNAREVFKSPVAGGHNHFPVWSPDGRWIYFVTGIAGTQEMDLWRIAESGGKPERLTQHNSNVQYPTPIDSRTLLYLSLAPDGSGPWLWALDVERKETRRISHGLEKYISLSASGNGRRLVASVSNPTADLSSVPILDRPAEERDVKPFPVPTVRALAPRFFGPASLFYLSSLGSGDGLWRYQGGQLLEIWKGTNGTLFEPAAVSPDGKRVAISLRRQGRIQLNVMSDDGTGLMLFADTLDVRGSASWSPDGNWIVTGGRDANGQGVFKVPVGGGPPFRLAAEAGFDPVWSPRGDLIVYSGDVVAAHAPLLAVRPDGAPVELPVIQVRTLGQRHRFLPNGEGLIYMQGDGPSQDFWLLDLKTWERRPLTRLANSGTMRTFDVTPDGKQIVFDRLRDNSDLALIDLR